MSFTKWMESEFFLDINDTAKCMKSLLLHKVAQPLSTAYANRKLPPGYSGYMSFGPKAQSGDWADLAMAYPIVMFIMGIAVMVSIAGLSYCILLYLGRCGSKYSCERPFQRYWRIVLCVLMFALILLSIPSLWIAYNSSFYLMLMSLDVDKPPDVKEMLSQSILQYNHVFKTNAKEFLNFALSEGTDLNTKLSTDMGYKIGNQTADLEADILKNIDSLKNLTLLQDIEKEFPHAFRQIVMAKEAIRRVHRQFCKRVHMYDGVMHTLASVPFRSLLTTWTSLDMVRHMNASVIAFRTSLELMPGRLTQLPAATEVAQTHVTDVSSAFLEKWREFLEGEVQNIESRGKKLTSFLSESIQSSMNSASDTDSAKINIPPSLSYFGLLNCIILTLIMESLIVVMVIGIIGTRGPRDTFGLNKTTSSKLLTINVIAITAVFSLSALIACHHFFFAAVIQNGVCNLESTTSSTGKGGSNMFLACKVPETIYTKLISEKLIEKISFNEKPATFDEIINEYVNSLKDNPTPNWDNSSSTENIMKEAEKAINITSPKTVVWRYKDRFTRARDILDIIRKRGWYTTTLNCYRNYYQTLVLNAFGAGYGQNYANFMTEKMRVLSRQLNGGTVPNHFKYLCQLIDKAYSEFNSDAERVKPLYRDIFVSNLRKYSKWVDKAMLDIGKCGLLAEQYQESFKASCNCLTDPLNAYWIGIFSVLLITLPIIVTGIALANLFKKVCVDYTPKTER